MLRHVSHIHGGNCTSPLFGKAGSFKKKKKKERFDGDWTNLTVTFKVGQSGLSLLSTGFCCHMRRRPDRAPDRATRARQPRLNSI